MGNTTTLFASKEWHCCLHSPFGSPSTEWKSSPTFTINKLSQPLFKISARFGASRVFSINIELIKSTHYSIRCRAGLAEVNIQIYGHIVRRTGNKTQRLFTFTQNSGIFEWRNDCRFTFDKFPEEFPDCGFGIFIQNIRCKIIWHGWIQTMPLSRPSMSDMKFLLINPKFSDVTLVVEDQELPAHKIVLANHSPVFAAMFAIPMTESRENRVIIRDADVNTMIKALKFLYTGETADLRDIAVTWDVFNIARKYEIARLKDFCGKKLMEQLNIGDVLSMVDTIDDSHTQILYEAMVEYDFILSKKPPKYPVEFLQLMQKVFEDRIDNEGADTCIIKSALLFWYTGTSKQFERIEIIWDIFDMTQIYDIKECKNFCELKLLSLIDIENVIDMLDSADDFGSKTVYWRALDFAVQRRLEMSERKDFQQLCHKKPKLGVDFLEYCSSQHSSRVTITEKKT